MSGTNLQVRMKRHPQGMVTPDDFDIAHADLPALKEGEALVRSQYLSLDPYMRPRMDPLRSYVEPLKIGELMPGAGVGCGPATFPTQMSERNARNPMKGQEPHRSRARVWNR